MNYPKIFLNLGCTELNDPDGWPGLNWDYQQEDYHTCSVNRITNISNRIVVTLT